jgi:hypothetical protein
MNHHRAAELQQYFAELLRQLDQEAAKGLPDWQMTAGCQKTMQKYRVMAEELGITV